MINYRERVFKEFDKFWVKPKEERGYNPCTHVAILVEYLQTEHGFNYQQMANEGILDSHTTIWMFFLATCRDGARHMEQEKLRDIVHAFAQAHTRWLLEHPPQDAVNFTDIFPDEYEIHFLDAIKRDLEDHDKLSALTF